MKIVIADDHPLFRAALAHALRDLTDGSAPVEASSLRTLEDAVHAHADLDLVLLDLHMPGARGFSSLVFLRVFGFPERDFGFLFGCIMIGNIGGAALGSHLVMRYGIERLLMRAVVLSMVAGVGMAALAWAHVDHVLAVLVPMFLYMLGFSLVIPQSMAGALSPFPHLAGNASALLGVIQWSFASLVGEAVGQAGVDG